MLTLSIAIMHCSWSPDRVKMLQQILERLDKDLKLLSGFSICDDTDRRGIWWNCKQAWNKYHPRSTHHLVLQDDMLPCHNFIPALLKLIEIKPTQIIHIFASNVAVLTAQSQNKHWYTTPEGSWGGAVMLPRFDFGWCEWSDQHLRDFSIHNDDTRLDNYALCHQKLLWNTSPSLIEHIGYDKSLIGNNNASWRMSKLYIGNQDPLQLDWNLGANDPVQGDTTWMGSYDQLHSNLKPEYRKVFQEKINYQSKTCFPLLNYR